MSGPSPEASPTTSRAWPAVPRRYASRWPANVPVSAPASALPVKVCSRCATARFRQRDPHRKDDRFDLLVVPPDTTQDEAEAAMSAADEDDNSRASELLASIQRAG
jgi:hypothetical protein